MNISEAARLSGLSSKQIRDYEKNGLLPPAERSDSGYRQYTAEELETLRFIRHARDVGFSLKQIERLLQLQRNPQRSRREVSGTSLTGSGPWWPPGRPITPGGR